MADWAQALQVGGFGFLRVIVTLGVLCLALWLVSKLLFVLTKKRKPADNSNKNGAPIEPK
jgi:hypothetical protein